MRLGLLTGYFGPDIRIDYDLILEAERLGYTRCGRRKPTGATPSCPSRSSRRRQPRFGLGTAIMQMPARTPAMAAMTAMTIDRLSGGRFRLGIGPIWPAGRRGLARGRLWTAPLANARVREHRPQGPGTRRPTRTSRLPLPDSLHRARVRPGSASRSRAFFTVVQT